MKRKVPTQLQADIEQLLHSDEGEYAYLFPYRNRIPEVKSHPFMIVNRDERIDSFVVKTMLDPQYIGWTAKVVLGINLFPMQLAILQSLWNHPFPMLVATRGGGKSYILAVYAVLRALLEPKTKIVIVGAGLRQAKLVFNYIEDIWNSAPVLRSIVGGGRKAGPKQSVDLCFFRIGESMIYALPLGDGTKIRGFRANVVIADEFASIPEEVFDIVVRGFTATAKSPVEAAKHMAIRKRLRDLDMPQEMVEQLMVNGNKGNQIIYSGTAYYAFNHFAKRFEMWCRIVKSRGDREKVAEIFGSESNIPENFDYSDYVVIRLPYTHVQEGLMDMRQLAHAKAVLPSNIFLMEYGACFVRDSNGFFPRSLIEACSCSPSRPIETPDGSISFSPMMQGVTGRRYVIGIDPAAERDNLAVTVLEVWPHHFRVVHSWAVNKPEFEKRKKKGFLTIYGKTDLDYYEYCVHKIKEIIGRFPPARVVMDSQGGGHALAEMLRNPSLCVGEEKPIYEIVVWEEPKPHDSKTDGPHVIELIAQTSEYNSQSNVFMHKSFETKRLLFPAFDTVRMMAALQAEKALNVTFDTYEDVVNCIEELKNEICTIQMTQTPTGKEHFDTPTISTPTTTEGHKKRGRLRKDRYTSILLAHRFAYDSTVTPGVVIDYDDVAGNIRREEGDLSEGMYRGPGIGQMRNAEWCQSSPAVALKRGRRVSGV